MERNLKKKVTLLKIYQHISKDLPSTIVPCVITSRVADFRVFLYKSVHSATVHKAAQSQAGSQQWLENVLDASLSYARQLKGRWRSPLSSGRYLLKWVLESPWTAVAQSKTNSILTKSSLLQAFNLRTTLCGYHNFVITGKTTIVMFESPTPLSIMHTSISETLAGTQLSRFIHLKLFRHSFFTQIQKPKPKV